MESLGHNELIRKFLSPGNTRNQESGKFTATPIVPVWHVIKWLSLIPYKYLVKSRRSEDLADFWGIFWLNSLAPGKFELNLRHVIFKQILVIDGWGISCEIVLIWMSLDFTDD